MKEMNFMMIGRYLLEEDGRAGAVGMTIGKECIWKIAKANVPYMPDWAILRPMISNNYLLTHSNPSLGSKMNIKQMGKI